MGGFIDYLKSRADRADGLVDYGFIKVQTDVYRVRQLVLGTTAATRLAISPALATIAQAETAVASQEQISTFFQNLDTSTPAVRSTPPPRTTPATPGNVRITRSAAGEPPAAFETVATAPRERSASRGRRRAAHAPAGCFGLRQAAFTTLASRPAFGGGSVFVGTRP